MTINLNGVEFYSAQEVDARIREAIAGKNKEVDMTNLPIGTLVKVVGNIAEHEHEVGEILPITEVDEGCLDELYRLDGRGVGWVAVEDIEFVSFPEEEESTSGDEGLTVDEDDSAPKFEVGDKVRVKGADYHSLESGDIGTVTDIAESVRHTHNGRLIPTPYEVTINNNLGQFVAPEHLGLIEEVESEDSEIKAGDIVIATEDELDITEGAEYEIKERDTGLLYFFDDDGDIRHVSVHEDRLRKKTAKRGFKKGDIVYIKEEITDFCGDSIISGVLTEFIEAEVTSGVRNPDGRAVMVEDRELDKLTLVCRAEDRLDK